MEKKADKKTDNKAEKKERVKMPNPGTSEKTDAIIMNISTVFFRDKVMINKDAGLISIINMQTEDVGNTLGKHNGKLVCVTRSGITAMFESGCDDALKCAITICQEAELEERKPLFKGLSIGIDYGTICVGVVGYNGFDMPLVMSETMDNAIFLSESALKYNSRILITSNASIRLADFQMRYNSRRLGKIYHAATGAEEDIYDVYDGDLADTKYSKMRSRLFFETGVDLFLKGKYLEARSYFIELLKFDRYDAAAKQYVFRCDSCLAGTSDEYEKQYLELR
ncbi:MAG: hypothetical protein IJU82_03635 [Ruminiclostridium sp.]|nr:hypothetical protein [Ruminiclostridium sp.]